MNTDDERFQEIVRRIRAGDQETTEAVKDDLAKFRIPGRQPPTFPEPGKGWYTIRVELVSGLGQEFDPPPGRDFLVSPQHTFRQLAEAINATFARWDLGHLYVFRLGDGTMVGTPGEDLSFKDAARTKIARRLDGETFEYEFDFGDSWEHRCTVLETDVEPEDVYGVRPKGPVAVWGWGSLPDQYGRATPDG